VDDPGEPSEGDGDAPEGPGPETAGVGEPVDVELDGVAEVEGVAERDGELEGVGCGVWDRTGVEVAGAGREVLGLGWGVVTAAVAGRTRM